MFQAFYIVYSENVLHREKNPDLWPGKTTTEFWTIPTPTGDRFYF